MSKREKKPMSLYKKSLLIYSGVIVLLLFALLAYMLCSLKSYEKYELDNFIKDSIANLSNKDLIDVIDEKKLTISPYDKLKTKKSVIKAIDKSLEDSKNIKYEQSKESKSEKKPIYDIYYKDKLILTIKLANKGEETKLKILSYTKWELVDIKSHIEEGLYEVKANIPEDYKLYINGKLVKESEDTQDEKTALFAQYADVKKFKSYNVEGLIQKPKVVIKDENGKEVKTVVIDGVITAKDAYFKTDNNEEAMVKLVEPFEVLPLAEKYSLFLTDDLTGGYHGFTTLRPYLIEGTEMYKNAYEWGHGIDVTFTSRHSLKNPVFTDEKLSNFVIYSDKAFSVDVSLKKNMIVSNEDRIMEMNDRLSFVYYDGGWKLISMESI